MQGTNRSGGGEEEPARTRIYVIPDLGYDYRWERNKNGVDNKWDGKKIVRKKKQDCDRYYHVLYPYSPMLQPPTLPIAAAGAAAIVTSISLRTWH